MSTLKKTRVTNISLSGNHFKKSFKVDVHFKDKFDGPDNYCGIEIEYDTEKPEYLVGISIMGAISINLT